MAAQWKQVVIRRALVGLLIAVLGVSLVPASPSWPQSPPFLQGRSFSYGWVLDIQGSRGRFQAGGLVWTIEYIFRTPGLNGFAYGLWFLGRRPETFSLLFISVNDAGSNFFVEYYNYQENILRLDRFSGSYNINGLRANPTLMSGYRPTSHVPSYEGPAFSISSPYAQVTQQGGTVSTEKLQLQVYPLYRVTATTTWHEIWALGLDTRAEHSYFLIFYTTGPESWVIDLQSGNVQLLPLGRVILGG
jgi:hypothetical protein